MTTKHTLFFGRFAVLLGVLRAWEGLCRALCWQRCAGCVSLSLISGSYPSLTRDPGIAAYRLLEGHPATVPSLSQICHLS